MIVAIPSLKKSLFWGDIMELKEKCKLARKYMKMSQEQFAKVIKSNQTEVSFIERGFIPEDEKKIDKIETIYKWSLES